MNMKLIHWLVAFLSGTWSIAQPSFVKIFNTTGTARADLHELSSGNLFAGMSGQSGTSVISPQGTFLQTHSHAIDTLLALQSVERYSDNEFYFTTGYYKDTCTTPGFGLITRIYPTLGRMDSLGNILEARHYVLNSSHCTYAGGETMITRDRAVLLWGQYAMFFAMKVDSMLGVLWARTFSEYGGVEFIKELPSGDLLAGMNVANGGAVVARMDADGNFLWCKSYVRPRGMVHDAVIESDSSFIITGFTDTTASTNAFNPLPQDFQPKLFMMKLNGDGDVQWCRGYDSAPNYWYSRGASRIVRTLDGNYAVLSTLAFPGYNLPLRPLLMKTDQNGDTLWRDC